MKYLLLALLLPVFSYAQKERSSKERPSTVDCPTWANKPKSSKVAFFETARSGRKNTVLIQKTNVEKPDASEKETYVELNRNRKIIPESPITKQEKIAITERKRPLEISEKPLEKEKDVVLKEKKENKKIEQPVIANTEAVHAEKSKKIKKEKIKKEKKKIRKREIKPAKKTKARKSKKQKCPEF